jgi:hypothetical protein
MASIRIRVVIRYHCYIASCCSRSVPGHGVLLYFIAILFHAVSAGKDRDMRVRLVNSIEVFVNVNVLPTALQSTLVY